MNFFKKTRVIASFGILVILNGTISCNKDDDDAVVNAAQDPVQVINTVNQGTWRITFYQDSQTDETSNFSGYTFTFGASNVLTATNGSTNYTGTWSVTNSDSNDDNPSNDLDFNIGFSSPQLFDDELTDDWDIISYTSTKIQLIDISGGNGGTDYLTFEKN